MSTIKLRRSGITGKIPTTAQLDLGELALNTYDGRLYVKKSVNSVESIVGFYGSPVNEESIYVDSHSGDGSTTDYSLSFIPKADQYVYATINGVQQHIDAYSISGTTLTFSSAPANNDVIELRTHDTITDSVAVRDYATYVYTANNDTSFSGSDDNGNTLVYDIEKVEVYANGARLVDTLDYTATDGSSVTIQQAVSGTVEIVSLSRATFADHIAIRPSTASFTTTNANQVADRFQAAALRTAKYLVQMTAGTDYHTTEVLLIHDGTTAYITEYGTIFTNASLGTVDADISGGYVRLLVTPANINTTVKTQRISVTV